ncbi:hypothetical protein Bca101_009681 [Brassica carinata]
MPSSTRSNKASQLLLSEDPASLERSIRKEICSDTDAPLSTETRLRRPILAPSCRLTLLHVDRHYFTVDRHVSSDIDRYP